MLFEEAKEFSFASFSKKVLKMFTEDLHQFLKDFGVKVSFTMVDGTTLNKDLQGNDLIAIYDESYSDSSMGYLPIRNIKPRLTCVQEDVASVPKGASVTINGKTMKVLNNEGDGTGFAIIELSKQ